MGVVGRKNSRELGCEGDQEACDVQNGYGEFVREWGRAHDGELEGKACNVEEVDGV